MDRQALSDDATVLRAGKMLFEDLRRNALSTFHNPRFERLGISVRAGSDLSDLELMTEPGTLGHSSMRRSGVGRLRAAGFEIDPTLEPHHSTIWLPDIEDHTLEALVSAFGASEANPAS